MAKRRRNEFKVYASRECIDNSERNSLTYCIWAMAIVTSIRGSMHVQVDQAETRFTYLGMRYIFATPEKSARIAKMYDDGLLLKSQIQPWSEWLIGPVSVEPVQHRRQSKKHKRTVVVKRSHTKSKTRRCSRWSGVKI